MDYSKTIYSTSAKLILKKISSENYCFRSSRRLIIKPNFVSTDYSQYSDPGIIKALLRLDGRLKLLIIESNSHRQTSIDYLERIKQDKIILPKIGWKSIFENPNCNFLNIDQEKMNRGTKAIMHTSQKIHFLKELKNWNRAPFISMTKLKRGSGTIKNLFGIMPEGERKERRKLHRPLTIKDDVILNYFSYIKKNFPLYGLIDGIKNFPEARKEGYYFSNFRERYNVKRNRGVFIFGDPLEADLIKCRLMKEVPDNLIISVSKKYYTNTSLPTFS